MSSHRHLNSSSGEIDHVHSLSKDIEALYLSKEYSDVTLVVAGHKLCSHKFILAARSEYFRALLFNGMKESMQNEIEVNASSLPAFENLLKYIYTGCMSLANERVETILDILALAHLYVFVDLEDAISDYLREILNIKNICSILDTALLYRLKFLTNVCLEYMDKHASEILQHESFLQLSPTVLSELISRDSFYAPELDIFLAVDSWVKANPEVNNREVIAQLRLSLISKADLMTVVRKATFITDTDIINAVHVQLPGKQLELPYRRRLLIDANVASPMHGAQVLQGEARSYLLNGDTKVYDNERGFTWHDITNTQERGILIKLGAQYIINHVKMLLWDRGIHSYSFFIEGSVDQNEWVKLVDYTKYFCGGWQYLYFPPRVVLYIRIVGTNQIYLKDNMFPVVHFEAHYTNHTEQLSKGFIVPTQNIAVREKDAYARVCATDDKNIVMRYTCNNLLNGDTTNYDENSGYTWHELGSEYILVRLAQPYMIDSMRFLLWDRDNRSYSYTVEVSGNLRSWVMVADKREELCQSWQIIHFNPPRPVVFIRIMGTLSHDTADESFRCVHFECPAQFDDKSPKSPT
ncbi:BTB/POZ domain-containing protein 9 [Formica fusca]